MNNAPPARSSLTRVQGPIAVIGAGGFIGRRLTSQAAASGREVVGVVRSAAAAERVAAAGGRPVRVAGLDPGELSRALEGARAVVHLAHIGAERGGATYEAVNVEGTRHMIAAARSAGVGRVVLFSGLGVARYGQSRRCTNRYFLSKLSAEVELFRSDREAFVFRPSYVVGPGDALVGALVADLAAGDVERPGDGSYRLQPVAVRDAADAAIAAADAPAPGGPRVFDLVGPEALGFDAFVARAVLAARAEGLPVATGEIRSVEVAEAERRAAAGGYRGMLPDELDCLLCDETAAPGPLARLLGRPLTPLDPALREAVGGSAARTVVPGA
jgi:NADH dehydrogenase